MCASRINRAVPVIPAIMIIAMIGKLNGKLNKVANAYSKPAVQPSPIM